MPKYFFIAEKPSLMRDIQTAYGTLKTHPYDAVFTSVRGHFMELIEPDEYDNSWGKPYTKDVLPMIPNNFKYKVKKGCLPDYNKIKSELNSGKYDFVVNACDAGREGEAIFWTLYNHIGCKLPAKRLWASDTTVETLSKALENILDYNKDIDIRNLRDSSLCRIEFDWLVGMNLSRAAMVSTHKAVSVGRVKSPTTNIVVMRDLEIANFKPKDYFEVEADFDGYIGTWFKDNKTSFENKKDAEDMISKLGKTGIVSSIKKDTITNYAPPLYSLAELQKEANRIYGFTASETLEIAQELYEKHKILSYPRTESRALSTAMGKEVSNLLEAIKDIPEVSVYVKKILADPTRIANICSNKKYVDNKKVTDHHALVNTKKKPDLSKLTDKEKKVFLLVIKKFVSIFLDPYISDKTTVITDIDDQTFKTVGSVTVQNGFKELWTNSSSSSEDDTPEIPKVTKGETRTVKNIKILGKQTQPPKPYTDSSLLDAMQNAGKFVDSEDMKDILNDTKGLGTSATRAGIIDGLIDKNFLYRKGKTIRATEFGIAAIKILDSKDIISPILTAKWEEKLRDIENGKISDSDFRNLVNNFIKNETDVFLTTLTPMENVFKNSIGICPICGLPVIESEKYFICTGYKKEDKTNCTFISSKIIGGKNITTDEFKKILDGKETKKMKFKNKDGKTFDASIKFDPETKRLSYVFSTGNVVGKCPKCGNNIIDKGGSYGCETEGCDFFIAKNIKGASISSSDVKSLLSGKTTESKKFFKGNKPWFAKLKYSSDFSKLEFEFEKNKK